MSIKKHIDQETECEIVNVDDLTDFISGKLNVLNLLKSNYEFCINNIINNEYYDVNDLYDMDKIREYNKEISILNGQIKVYNDMMKELS